MPIAIAICFTLLVAIYIVFVASPRPTFALSVRA